MPVVGKRLNAARREAGMSYKALADASGVSISSIWGMLRGHDPNPRFASLEAVARALGADLPGLIAGADGDGR